MSVPSSSSSRPRLSVGMIVRDAADLVDPSIQSVRHVADEVVVVDTGSVDATAKLARQAGAKVIERPWGDDFAEARNACQDNITGDFIFWLDAGETLAERDAADLRSFIDKQADANVAYLVYIELPPSTAQASREQIGRIRLTANRPDLVYSGRVRESLLPSVAAAELSIETLPWKIHRGEREHDIEVKTHRARRNLQLAELEIAEHGERAEMLVVGGEALAVLGRHAEAADRFRRAVELAQRGSTEMLDAYYGLLTSLDGDPRLREAQVSVCLEALDVFPLDAQLLCGMGSYMLSQNRADLAARSYSLATEHGHVDPQTWHLAEIGEVSAACLSLALQLQGEDDAAIEALETALRKHPKSARLVRQEINLHINYGRSREALAAVDRIFADTPGRETLRSAVRGAVLAAQKNWIAALPYLTTAYNAGCRDPLCLRWLAVTHLSRGDVERAAPVVAQWHALEPSSAEAAAYLEAIARERKAGKEKSEAVPEPSMPSEDAESRRLRVDTSPSKPHPEHKAPERPIVHFESLPRSSSNEIDPAAR